jgi:hypothetical protein
MRFFGLPSAALLIIAVLLSPNSIAQKLRTDNPVWKRRVVRNLEWKEPKGLKNDETLLGMILKEGLNLRLNTYSNFDQNFTNLLSFYDLRYKAGLVNDTVTVKDPINGSEKRVVQKRNYDYSEIQTYRTLEEWTFNPATGKTEIQITGIAPRWPIERSSGNVLGEI